MGCQKRFLAQDARAGGYVKASDKASAFPRDVSDLGERDLEVRKGISAIDEMSDTGWSMELIWLCVVC